VKKGKDIFVNFKSLYIVHQNLPGYEKKQVKIKDHILFLPLSGEIHVKINDKAFILGSGKMLYLPPQCSHSFSSTNINGERMFALINTKEWDLYKTKIFSPIIINSHPLLKEIILYLFLNKKTPFSKSLISVFVQTLQVCLSQTKALNTNHHIEHLESRVSDSRCKIALEFMKTHGHNKIDMKIVARKSGLSLRSLNRLILDQTGLSPRNILIRYRIAQACDLLKTKKSITQVAYDVGYQSMSQFINAFRSVTGQLPSEYQ
jgi:AraC-like DNA-binding protein